MDLEDLPPVTGRHRNRALAAERRRHAVEMALTGHTYQAIADRLGYASRGTVYKLVTKALEDQQVESVDELRQLELSRLDMLQYAYWDRALEGDQRAALIVLKIMDRRLKLLALPVAWSSTAPEPAQPVTTWW